MPNINELLAGLDNKRKQLVTDLIDLITNPKETITRNQAAQREAGGSYTEDLLQRIGKAASDPNALRAPPFEEPTDSPLDLYGGMSHAAIDVWHGGPHLIKNKFDASKFNTGERGGFGIFGHYLGEAQNTGHYYAFGNARHKLVDAEGFTIPEFDVGPIISHPDWGTSMALSNLKTEFGYSRNQNEIFQGAIKRMEDDLNLMTYAHAHEPSQIQSNSMFINALKDGIKTLKEWRDKGYKYTDDKHLYEVKMRWPNPERETADPLSRKHFLNLDDLMMNQSPEIAKLNMEYLEGLQFEQLKNGMWKARNKDGEVITYHGPSFAGMTMTAETPQELVRKALSQQNLKTGRDVYEELKQLYMGNRLEVADFLHERGIPGIRYLDEAGRSYNYAVGAKDEDILEIVKHTVLPNE